MKKYIKPNTEELILNAQPIMTGSITPDENRATVSQESVPSGTPGEAHGFNVWDDEEEY